MKAKANLVMATLLLLTLSTTSRANTIFDWDQLEAIGRQNSYELLAEWVFLDFLVKSIEFNLKTNESLGISNQEHLLIKIPAVLAAGLAIEESERRIGTAIVRQLTPDKSLWFSEYRELRKSERNLQWQFNKALHAGTPDVVRLKYELTQVQRTLEQKMNLKPGALYRTGRALRGIGKTTVWIGGAAIAAIAVEDAAILAIGKQETLAILEKLKAQASNVERIIESSVSL